MNNGFGFKTYVVMIWPDSDSESDAAWLVDTDLWPVSFCGVQDKAETNEASVYIYILFCIAIYCKCIYYISYYILDGQLSLFLLT